MAAVKNLYRLTFGGRLFDLESWSCTLHLDGDVINGHPAGDFQTAIARWVAGPGNAAMSAAARLDVIKFNRVIPFVLPTGKTSMRYASLTTNVKEQNDMAIGVNTRAPGQWALACSLRTSVGRGRAHAGRIYAPTGAEVIDSTGRITVSNALELAVSTATLIRDVNAVVAADGSTSVVVFSNVGQIVNNVTSIHVGRVVDTMRSRRASLIEEPQIALVNP